MRIVTVHMSYQVPKLQPLRVPWRLDIQIKVMSLVSEAHFPAQPPRSWLVSGGYITVVAQGDTEKVTSRVKDTEKFLFKFIRN